MIGADFYFFTSANVDSRDSALFCPTAGIAKADYVM